MWVILDGSPNLFWKFKQINYLLTMRKKPLARKWNLAMEVFIKSESVHKWKMLYLSFEIHWKLGKVLGQGKINAWK